jgi:mono/diheme cytochrome c family protein
MRRTGIARVLVLGAVLGALAGCGSEDLDTGEPVPPPTEVVTDTTAEETTTGGEAAEGDPEAGREVFLSSAGCAGCHTLSAAGSTGTTGPDLDEAQPSFDEAVTVITNGRGGMPTFEGQLTEEQISDVAAFVAESAGSG